MTTFMVVTALEAKEEQTIREAWRVAALTRTSKFPKDEEILVSSPRKTKAQTVREQYVMAKFLTSVTTTGKAN